MLILSIPHVFELGGLDNIPTKYFVRLELARLDRAKDEGGPHL